MENEAAVLQYFKQEIDELVKKEKEAIYEEVDGIFYKAIKEYENKAESDAKYRYERVILEKSKDFSKKQALMNTQKNVEIGAYREALAQKVFNEVKDKLTLFVQSTQYVESVKEKVMALKEKIDLKDVCLYIRKQDLENPSFQKWIKETQIKTKSSDEICLGGFILENNKQGFRIDASYDSLFEEGKEWFYQNANFRI